MKKIHPFPTVAQYCDEIHKEPGNTHWSGKGEKYKTIKYKNPNSKFCVLSELQNNNENLIAWSFANNKSMYGV